MTNLHTLSQYKAMMRAPGIIEDLVVQKDVEAPRSASFPPVQWTLALMREVSRIAAERVPERFQPLARRAWLFFSHRLEDSINSPPGILVKTKNIQALATGYLLNEPDQKIQVSGGYTLRDGPIFGFSSSQIRSLFHSKGVCLGTTYWAIYLYFETQERFPDVETQMKAIARQFSSGAPKEALLLQSYKECELDELILEMTYSRQHFNIENIEEEFSKASLDLGPYCVKFGTPSLSHAMFYLKTAEKHFLLDPNYGLRVLTGQEDLLDKILEYSEFFKIEDITFGKFNKTKAAGEVLFTPCEIGKATEYLIQCIPESKRACVQFSSLIQNSVENNNRVSSFGYEGTLSIEAFKEFSRKGKDAILLADPDFMES